MMQDINSKKNDYMISKPTLLAVLLYAKGPKGMRAEEIIGITRLMKLMFLLIKEGGLEKYTKNSNGFIAYKYGPFDSEIYDAVEALQSLNIIEKTENNELLDDFKDEEKYDNKIRFTLTNLGIDKTEKIVKNMPEDVYNNIEKIKIIYSRRPLIQLLHYVYSKYPDYAVNSELNIT